MDVDAVRRAASEPCAASLTSCSECKGSGECTADVNDIGDCKKCGWSAENHWGGSRRCTSCFGWGTETEYPCWQYINDTPDLWCDSCKAQPPEVTDEQFYEEH